AADGEEDGADAGPVLEDLERDGTLPRDDVRVVERRDHGEAALGGDGLGAGLPLGGGGALEHDLGAQAAGALDLDVRGGDGHDDDGGDLEEPRGEGDGLCVVAGGEGDDAGPALLLGQARDHGVGAPQLEGADALEVLALEADLGAGLVRQPVGREERGPDGDAVERTRRGPDALRRDERAHSPISSSSEGAPPAGASSSASREGAAGSAALASPFSSSSGTRRATSTSTSPSSSAMMRTPCVARPMTRISSQRTRFTTPLRVISISSSPFWTSLMATTFPDLPLVLKLITPLPPRCWSRYSPTGVRLPRPCSVTTSSVVSGAASLRTTTMPMTRSSAPSVMPRTPVATRPISRTSASWNRIAMPSRVARMTSSSPLVIWTSISSSPSTTLIALIPDARTWR